MARIRWVVPLGLAALAVFVVGCSDPFAGRYEVSGTIKLKGNAVPDGAVVTFVPQDG